MCWGAGPQRAAPQPVLLAHMKRCFVAAQGDSLAEIAFRSTENMVLPPPASSADVVKYCKSLHRNTSEAENPGGPLAIQDLPVFILPQAGKLSHPRA